MARIYLALALFATLLLVANLVVGLNGGDANGVAAEYLEARDALEVVARQQARGEAVTVELEAARSTLEAVTDRYQPIRISQRFHFLLGLLSALVVVLVNSISMTYFIGTSRWCREVVETYSLSPALIERGRKIKRRNIPWSLSGILLILAVITLGGASDPGANTTNPASWVVAHRLLAIAACCWIGWSFLQQVGLVGEQYELIEEIMEEVGRRGLEVEVRSAVGEEDGSPPKAD
jgi:hypothetical protein